MNFWIQMIFFYIFLGKIFHVHMLTDSPFKITVEASPAGERKCLTTEGNHEGISLLKILLTKLKRDPKDHKGTFFSLGSPCNDMSLL